MRSPILIASAIVCAAIFTASSCKKKSDDAATPTTPSYRVSGFVDSATSGHPVKRYAILYDGSGRPLQTFYTNEHTGFHSYQNWSKVDYEYYTNGCVARWFGHADSIFLDADGNIIRNGLDSVAYYSGTSKVSFYGPRRYSAPASELYFWQGDNIDMRVFIGADTTRYTYLPVVSPTPQPSSMSDIIFRGRVLFKSKNLQSSLMLRGGWADTTTYVLDSLGRIVSAIRRGGTFDGTDSETHYYFYTY